MPAYSHFTPIIMRTLLPSSLFAALPAALALGMLVAGCQQTSTSEPEPSPTGSIPATVRSFVSSDSCRSFLLVLADSGQTKLRPMGKLWQAYQPVNGKRVLIEYITTVADSTLTGCRSRVGKRVTLTCISPATTGGN